MHCLRAIVKCVKMSAGEASFNVKTRRCVYCVQHSSENTRLSYVKLLTVEIKQVLFLTEGCEYTFLRNRNVPFSFPNNGRQLQRTFSRLFSCLRTTLKMFHNETDIIWRLIPCFHRGKKIHIFTLGNINDSSSNINW